MSVSDAENKVMEDGAAVSAVVDVMCMCVGTNVLWSPNALHYALRVRSETRLEHAEDIQKGFLIFVFVSRNRLQVTLAGDHARRHSWKPSSGHHSMLHWSQRVQSVSSHESAGEVSGPDAALNRSYQDLWLV